MNTIIFANQKGGVSKTTSALCIAAGLQLKGKKVLFIDADPQCNSSTFYQAKTSENTLFEFYNKEKTLPEIIQSTEKGDIVSCTKRLAGSENNYNAYHAMMLKKGLAKVKDNYDFCIIDTPPNLGFYLQSALIAGDFVIVPIDSDKFAVNGLSYMVEAIEDAKEANEDLKFLGVMLTKFDKRMAQDREIRQQLPELGKQCGFRVFNSVIRTSQDIKKSQTKDATIFEAYPYSNAAADYKALVDEILKEIKKWQKN